MRAAAKTWFVLAACIAFLVSGCGGSSPARHAAAAARNNLQSIFEDEQVLSTETPVQAFATFSSLGVQTLRVFVPWASLAPDPYSFAKPALDLTQESSYAASYWSYLDAIVRQAKASGIRLLFTVGAPAPYWALGAKPKTLLWVGSWKPDATDFGDLMTVLGKRYSGTYTPPGATSPLPRVSSWSIWNEPNGKYLTPNAVGAAQTPYAPRLYRALLDSAWQGLARSGHGPRTDTILIGETAPRGLTGAHLPGNSGGLLPLIFIRALYCVSDTLHPLSGPAARALGCPASGGAAAFKAANPGLFEASGWADHPYSDVTAPTVKVPLAVAADYTDFASLPHLESTLDQIFHAYGAAAKLPIYATEYGYKTDPPNPLGIPNATAAAYMNETEYLSWINPRIRSYSQYLLIDPKAGSGNAFDTGLEAPGATALAATPKPDVYAAYRMPLWLPRTTAAKGQPLTVWGCARPVNDAHLRAPVVTIGFAAAGSRAYRSVRHVRLDPAHEGCYFTASVAFQQSGSVRLSFDDRGSTITSRTQAITIH